MLTIRDCYSWLDSLINDSLGRVPNSIWFKFRDYRFRPNHFIHPPEEFPLKTMGLYTLDGYFSYWATHNTKVLNMIPTEKLLIVNSNQITELATEIAEFAGLATKTIVIEKTHDFKSPDKFNVLHEIGSNQLERKAQEHCGVIMELLFPDIKKISDAGI